MILEALGFYADHLAQVKYPKVKELYDYLIRANMVYHEGLHENWLGVKLGDPQYEEYQKVNAEYEGIRKKVHTLNAIERQLMLAFNMVSADLPKWVLTKERIMA
jgi:rubrerythrin